MRVLSKPLVALVATAWIAIAASALAVKFDGTVWQVINECEVVQEETAWAGEDNYWAPGTPKTNNWGSGFILPSDFGVDNPYVTGFYAGQHYIAGEVTVTRLPGDAHGVEVTIETFDGWVLGKTHVYAGHNPPPTNRGGKLVPGQFPQGDTFGCDTAVTYATYTFEKSAANALQVKKSIQAKGGQKEWVQTRNALKREWKFAGKPQPWRKYLQGALIRIAQEDPDPDEKVVYVAVHAEVCRCEPTAETLGIVPLEGAVVRFVSQHKTTGVDLIAEVPTDANGYYAYDSQDFTEAGYFANTVISVITPAGLVIPDVSAVELAPHPEFNSAGGTLAELYANFSPSVVGETVFSPNQGGGGIHGDAAGGFPKATKSVLNVDFTVLPF